MDKATKTYLIAAIGHTMGRKELTERLESTGTACFDDEPIEDLVEAFVDGIDAGDLEFPLDFSTAKSMPRHIYMLWFDIDDDEHDHDPTMK